MIKNVILDYGNTVVEFVPCEIVMRFGVTGERDVKLLTDVVFDRRYWDRLDAGTIKQEEFLRAVLLETPERLHKNVKEICDGWYKSLPVIKGMDRLISDLHRDGYKVFLLSNISRQFAEAADGIGILQGFDGLVMSSTAGFAKPDREIFLHLLKKYSLKADECVFIDDLQKNIDGAAAAGINGLLFDGNAQKAREFIYKKNNQA